MARKYADLLTWRTWLRSVFDGQVQLNTAGVAQAVVSGTTLGTDTWADQTYLTVTAELQVSILEGVNVSA
jgi:esterase/lipase